MTPEPERDPPASPRPTSIHSAPNVWGPAPDPADPNAPADPWAESVQSAPLADIVEVVRLAREYSTPFGEEPR